MTNTHLLGPVGKDQRIESIDVLRGVAVLGILALNIQSFAMPGSAYINPTSYGNFEGINYWVWYVVHLLGDMKFWTIFSMLFGAGIVMMSERCEATGRRGAALHYRRMGWLILFGLLHAHLIWYGDILYTYGMCGLAAYLFRRWRPASLFVLGTILLLVAFAISLAFGWLLNSDVGAEMKMELAEDWEPGNEGIQEELAAFRGSWWDQLGHRTIGAFFFETFLFAINFGWRSGGLILIGMGLYKFGVFSATCPPRFYRMLVAIAIVIGLPLVAYGIHRNEAAAWSLEFSFFYGPLYNYWGSILIALGWVGCVMLVCQRYGTSNAPVRSRWTAPLAAAGRMSLSCYLLQSILATSIYYGHGLGWFGYQERWQQYLTVVGIWGVCLVFASVWLKYFRFGPFEWLWRSLTYFQFQPMRRSPADRDLVSAAAEV
jgi:uncharacterized protein